ncbi:MAG: GNAT family N-acetyltransferase [Eubacteriales bacterium]|nr:GNAT family N-acetyltransferase [Eubacteriales bacterium]
MARRMDANAFQDWERVFTATQHGVIAGYCTLAKADCIPDVPYTPYIGFVFVGEAFRGQRLSERLIDAACAYARELGFDRVYLVSDHVGLYEKYGFEKADARPAPWDAQTMETIFVKQTDGQ